MKLITRFLTKRQGGGGVIRWARCSELWPPALGSGGRAVEAPQPRFSGSPAAGEPESGRGARRRYGPGTEGKGWRAGENPGGGRLCLSPGGEVLFWCGVCVCVCGGFVSAQAGAPNCRLQALLVLKTYMNSSPRRWLVAFWRILI